LKFSVIGAGGVGQVITRHLTQAKSTKVKVGDMAPARLREVKKISAKEVSVVKLDAASPDQVRRFVRGSDVVINASNPRFNLLIMKQALMCGVHYIDLAGDNPISVEQQLSQNLKWQKAGLLAVLGMGEDPGLSNIMARHGVDMLDTVSEIRIRDGETSTSETYPFVALFAPEVFLEEAISPARYFENGDMKTSPPMSGRELYRFPPPLGEVPLYWMDHEEVHTLPEFLPKRPNFVDFKLALTDEAVSAIKLFQGLGLLNRKPMPVGSVKVSPLSLLLRLLPTPSEIAGKIHGSAGILVEVKGVAGEPYTHKLYATMTHDEAYERHQTNATSYLTGTPTAVCALMLASRQIENRGVIVPECLDAKKFIEEARKFDVQVQMEKTRLQ
jgi:saccharopine dehydrogenase (NAD+, L-lysine-forming)